MEKHTGYTLYPLGMYITEELICVIPLFFRKIHGVKVVFSPPPQTGIPYLGYVLSSRLDGMKQSKRGQRMYEIGELFAEEINRLGANYVSILLTPSFTDIRPFKWHGFMIDPLYTFVIDLQKPLEDILKEFNVSKRKIIKKNESSDMQLVEDKDVSLLFDLSVQRYDEQGLKFPVTSKAYIEELQRLYPDQVKVYYIKDKDGNTLGAVMTTEHRRVTLWIGSVKPDTKAPVNEFLYWEFIKKSKAENYELLELGGADIPRLCAFKSQFNPTIETNYRIFKKDMVGKMAEWTYLNVCKKSKF
ncbi:GNAT family N-acetyltransferase [Methanolobus halotolerans]|uniref:GNAT family N-acetyltransferase n=1 Tax=Methanolobus halotolerans TaxID=2052935 RepID=UPI001F3D682E|nr:GNAT family N-acetyltransferase [Methanolobus halotolerans]